MVHGAQVGQVLLRRAPPHLGIIDVTQIDDRIGFGPELALARANSLLALTKSLDENEAGEKNPAAG
jgi:hypothetical protein